MRSRRRILEHLGAQHCHVVIVTEPGLDGARRTRDENDVAPQTDPRAHSQGEPADRDPAKIDPLEIAR